MSYERYIPLINNYWFRGIPDFDGLKVHRNTIKR